MFREKPKSIYHVNFLFNSGGLGDCIARLPAVNYVLTDCPNVIPHIWVPDYFLEFAKRSLPKGTIVRPFSENKKYNDKLPGRVSDAKVHTNLAYHMTDHAFNLLVNKQVEDKYKDYLPVNVDDIDISKFNLPQDYVVVCTGFTSHVREMLPKHINKISKYLVNKGYTPVYLGKTEVDVGYGKMRIEGEFREEIDFSLGINLVDKTTLLETTKIIYGAKTIVGLDNGLLHVASTHPELPVVGGFTTLNPRHRMAYRHGGILGYKYYAITPPESLKCRFCQSNMIFEFKHDFRFCYYNKEATGEEIECLKQISADLYIAELEKIL